MNSPGQKFMKKYLNLMLFIFQWDPRKDTGNIYQLQHQPSRKVNIEIGRKMLNEAAEELGSRVNDLRKYSKFIEEGNNPPYSVIP